MNAAIDFFPAPAFRKHQESTINQIQKLLEGDTKVVLLSAPTGSGKSFILSSLCQWSESSYYATPQILLVEQIEKDSMLKGRFAPIKGRSNYQCLDECGRCVGHYDCVSPCPQKLNCSNARCLRQKNYDCRASCPYGDARDAAQAHHNVLTTMAYLLTMRLSGNDFVEGESEPGWTRRKLLVLDEGHNVEKWVQNAISFKIEDIKKHPASFEEAVELAITAQEGATALAARLKIKMESPSGVSMDEYRKMKYAEAVVHKIDHLVHDTEHGDYDWVHYCQTEKDWHGKDINVVEYKPVTVGRYCHALWKLADRVIIASGTILNPSLFLWGLGLDAERAAMVEVPSTFPPENHKVVDATVGKMTYSNMEENRPKMLTMLDRILKIESGKRGIIHLPGYNHARYIEEHMSDDMKKRFVFHQSKDRNAAYKNWLDDGRNDSVLVAVNMFEGIDLKDERCRFTALAKCPYADLSDVYVTTRKSYGNGNDWYLVGALTSLIQATGRIIRSAEDWGTCYIIDQSIIDAVNRGRRWMPKWFMDSWNMRRKIDETV